MNFWHYDPGDRGWYVYGQGTVTPDGRQVVPDPGVQIYERLAPMGDQIASSFVSVGRLLGETSALLGEPGEARRLFSQALEVCQKVRFRPEIALIRLAMAELLLNGPPDERDESQAHLDCAIGEFQQVKMQPALERALSHKGLLKA